MVSMVRKLLMRPGTRKGGKSEVDRRIYLSSDRVAEREKRYRKKVKRK